MKTTERDELLIRIDQKQQEMHEDIKELQGLKAQVDQNTSDLKWLKWVGSTAIAGLSTIVGAFEWFKK